MGSTLTRYANTLAMTAGGLDPSSKSEPEEAGDLQELKEVFKIETINKDTFLPSAVAVDPAASGNPEKGSFTGKITCSVSFTAPDGCGHVAIGCEEGIWVGSRDDPQSMRHVLHLKMVTQCAMLERFGIFLVLADQTLFAYRMEVLVPSPPQNAPTYQTSQKLNNANDVYFFSVGTLHGRTLVIYMKKKILGSVFRVLEPVIDNINERANPPAVLPPWFRIDRDFFIPSQALDVMFLKAKIAILCTQYIEIMDLTDFKSVTIPQRNDPGSEQLAKRYKSFRAMGIFRSDKDKFLVCYDKFGLYVDKRGDPSQSIETIEWESTAEHVALHYPYVLIFNSRFIEIRHIETGRLTQIIPGNGIRCIWDGRGLDAYPPAATSVDGFESLDHSCQQSCIHAVMNGPESAATGNNVRPLEAVAQHVFELVPMVP